MSIHAFNTLFLLKLLALLAYCFKLDYKLIKVLFLHAFNLCLRSLFGLGLFTPFKALLGLVLGHPFWLLFLVLHDLPATEIQRNFNGGEVVLEF